ncbi:hypothetical protein PENSPDRAFT_658533 [Peniophora sp. CONT]|nr:hypothetical protein PENSPDRAFT_658533 [Peniophora sp. CONT]
MENANAEGMAEPPVHSQAAAVLEIERRQNDFVPIGRLPDEVLEPVFIYVRDSDTDELVKGKLIKYHFLYAPKWTFVTWVCRRFRAVCLGHPLLWSQIRNYTPKWLFAFLERSMACALDVRIDTILHKPASLKCILQSTPRMRALVLEGFAHANFEHVLSAMKVLTRELTTLSLLQAGGPLAAVGGPTVEAMVHIDNSLLCNVNQLRRLDLRGRISHIHPSSSLLSPSLEHLRLEGAYTAAELTILLREAPSLQSLVLRGTKVYAPPGARETPESITTIPLLRLSSLDIKIHFREEVPRLLHILNLPTLRHVSVTLASFHFGNPITTLSALSSLLQQCNNGAPFQSLRLQPIKKYSDGRCVGQHIALWHSPHTGAKSKFSHPPLSPPQADIGFQPRSPYVDPLDAHTLVSFYKNLCTCLPLASVSTLTIDINRNLPRSAWKDILRPLSRVEHLKLLGKWPVLILEALAITPFTLPALSHVAISRPMHAPGTSPPLLLELMGVAKARAGERRIHIAFIDCVGFASKRYESLREFADVTWDHMSFFDDGAEDEDEPWLALISG